MNFELNTNFKPQGDQIKAIKELETSIKAGAKDQVLYGVTGSGKTYTAANIIAKVNKPTLVISHNKMLAWQLYQEFKEFFPKNEVHYFEATMIITSRRPISPRPIHIYQRTRALIKK